MTDREPMTLEQIRERVVAMDIPWRFLLSVCEVAGYLVGAGMSVESLCDIPREVVEIDVRGDWNLVLDVDGTCTAIETHPVTGVDFENSENFERHIDAARWLVERLRGREA